MKVKNTVLFCLPFIASAAMLTVIQAPISWSFLAWVSLVPFILACSPSAKPKRLAVVAYLISLCYWLGNLYWIAPITAVGWITFCLYTAVHWPILALCLRYCRTKKIPLFLAAGVLFVGAERLQGFFLGGFFWRFLAHSQYANITLIQIADIFGAAGLSFLIAMVNGLLAELFLDARCSMLDTRYSILPPSLKLRRTGDTRCWKNIFKLKNFLKTALVCTAVVAAVVYGRWRISQEDEFVEAGPLVASLQSNVPQSVKRKALRGKGQAAEQTSKGIFDELMKQSEAGAEAGAELIVWPETMVQATLNPEVLSLVDSSHPWKAFDKALREHSKDTAFLLVGAYGGKADESKSRLTERYNSAFLYKTDGQQSDKQYSKIHLVLFGEVLPFRKSFPLLFKLLMKFNPYDYDHSLNAGSEYTVFEMDTGEDKGISHKDTKSQRELDISKKQKNSSCPGALVAENKRVYPVRNPTQSPDRKGGVTSRTKEKISNGVYNFSVIICYEATMPAIVRRFALDRQGRKQIDWLINISNDGWFVRFKGDKVLPSSELPQHAAICVFRAVENRLAVLRSVNTGISCLIDTLGRVKNGFLAGSLPHQAMARKGIAGWFVDQMPIDKRTTFFSKYGQWLDFCCALCLVLLIIGVPILRLIAKWGTVPLSARFIRNKKYVISWRRWRNEK